MCVCVQLLLINEVFVEQLMMLLGAPDSVHMYTEHVCVCPTLVNRS